MHNQQLWSGFRIAALGIGALLGLPTVILYSGVAGFLITLGPWVLACLVTPRRFL